MARCASVRHLKRLIFFNKYIYIYIYIVKMAPLVSHYQENADGILRRDIELRVEMFHHKMEVAIK